MAMSIWRERRPEEFDDEGGGGSVALGEIAGEEVEPEVFGGGAVGGGVFEDGADGEVG